MSNKYIIVLFVILFSLITLSISAQDINDVGAQNVNQLKLEGKLTGKERYTNRATTKSPLQISSFSNATQASSLCNCWITRDASFQIAHFDASGGSGGPGIAPEFRNDDWSTDSIVLPFDICFYGRSFNKVFLNNNGNISFDSAYSTFSANSFPDSRNAMIAPFWADIDTRGTLSGIVYYSVTRTHLIVQWENVGYFGTHDDKLNTFQLIITDGTDPIIPSGQNVSFCYKDMQWTTGDASRGLFGFGGVPATVGVNQGNGINYIQFGLFDKSGSSFDGAYGLNDGVDWLDNQSFTFNACILNTNIPPVLNSLNICDTIRLCQNTTYQLTANYLSPEQGEITNINFSSGGMSGVKVLSNTPGNAATLVLEIVGQTSNLGFHTISVTANDNGIPSASTNNKFVVEILSAPLPSFSTIPSSPVTTNTLIDFKNKTPLAIFLIWNFGDGSDTTTTINPQHTYTTGGTYNATLSAVFPNGCITNATQQILVCSQASFAVNNVCVNTPSTITYTGGSAASAQYIWDFNGANVLSGSGQGPYTISWSVPGTYSITLTVNESICSATVVNPLDVIAAPVASITALPQLCISDSLKVSFNGSAGTTATYTWDFGSAFVLSGSGIGPYNVLWNNPGNDQVSLIVKENGCSDTSQFSVLINPIPTANFIVPDKACPNDELIISYTGSASSKANFTWDFMGGRVISGAGKGPYIVSWKNSGNYLLSLMVSENSCTSVLLNVPLEVAVVPIVSISPIQPLCIGQTNTVIFNGNTDVGSIYNWSFGNATVISGSGPGPYTLLWDSAGIDQVQLSVDNNGCTAQSSVDVIVSPIPTSDFIVKDTACIGTPILLNYTGSASTSANYNWSFSGGTVVSGSGSGPYSVIWNSNGAFTISLTVDENGCLSTKTELPAMVNKLPFVFAGTDQFICSGTTVTIGSPAVTGETYLWSQGINLSDPVISNPFTTIVNNTLSTKEEYFILITTDSNGCLNSDTVVVSTYPEPKVNFNQPSSQCLKDNKFSFVALSNLPSGLNYSWVFSPEANIPTSVQSVVSIIYSDTGTFPITLKGDYNGCPALSFTNSVTVYEMPILDFIPIVTNGCEPLTVPFNNLSSGNGNTYNWNFGDGNSDNTNSATHVYQNAGDYSVLLNAINKFGCSADTTFINLISVYKKPKGQFSPSPQVTNILAPVIQFQNYSENSSSYLWDFGDNETSTDLNPSHRYFNIGNYNITLMLMSPNGCLDTVRGLVRVEETFPFYIPNSFTPNGDGINDSFQGYGIAVKNYRMNIYNRWGKLIFTTENYDKPWDGKVNSEVVQNDVYVYRIVLYDQQDEKHTYVGDVSVIK